MAERPARPGADDPAGSPAVTPERVRELALKALERRRRTRAELETILRRKGVPAPAFGPVLDRLTEVGLIDDLEYARVYLESRAAGRPRGARLLRGELQARGIPAELIDRALAERLAGHDPVNDAVRALRPWLARSRKLEPRERRRKFWEFLARRGFSSDVIEEAARRVGPGEGWDR